MDRPIIIAVTPVRNEAWVLDAYLSCTTSWADIVIIADQQSTDGTRDIIKRYQNELTPGRVVLIDNPLTEMDQAAARLLLFEEVDKIEGDKIVFAIDADEFLTPGFAHTAAWKEIMDSPTNTIFSFNWINLYGDFRHRLPLENNGRMEWVCHFDPSMRIAEEYYNCEKRAVHEMRVPCLPESRAAYKHIDEIKFIHLARLNLTRTQHKEDFYQVSCVAKLQRKFNAVSLYRSYHLNYRIEELDKEVRLLDKSETVDAKSKVFLNDIGQYYIDETLAIIRREGCNPFYKIDIWNAPYMRQSDIDCNIPFRYKVLFTYLKMTNNARNSFIIRVFDYIIKKL